MEGLPKITNRLPLQLVASSCCMCRWALMRAVGRGMLASLLKSVDWLSSLKAQLISTSKPGSEGMRGKRGPGRCEGSPRLGNPPGHVRPRRRAPQTAEDAGRTHGHCGLCKAAPTVSVALSFHNDHSAQPAKLRLIDIEYTPHIQRTNSSQIQHGCCHTG